jgi:hypothetical protein
MLTETYDSRALVGHGNSCAWLPVRLSDQQNGVMSAQEIDKYLEGLEEPKRTTLARLR